MARRPSQQIPRYRARRGGGGIGGILRWLARLVLGLFLFSILWVALYRVVDPPVTATMVGDMVAGRGAERSWMGLDRVDRDMVRAAIGAEDSKF